MIRRPPRSTLDRSSAASDVYKRQGCITYLHREKIGNIDLTNAMGFETLDLSNALSYSILFDKIPEYYLDSVSYTHLRAHETVLDLVCRLLLEKKNKNKQSPIYNITTHTR